MIVNVGIVGVGLIGGSLGMALRRARIGGKRIYRVLGWGRSRSKLSKAKRKRALDVYSTDPTTVFAHSDIVVFCVPVHSIPILAKRFRRHFKKNAIVTDVGSVKEKLLRELSHALRGRPDLTIVGAHPIAGSEKNGVDHARGDLFRRSTCIVVPSKNRRANKTVETLWRRAGARVVRTTAANHDRFLALTSHLPHLLSFSLLSLARRDFPSKRALSEVAGGSFRDMTRVAEADPVLWDGVFRYNRSNVLRTIREFDSVLRRLGRKSGPALVRDLKRIQA